MGVEDGNALNAFQKMQLASFVKGGNHSDGYIQKASLARNIVFLSLKYREMVNEICPYFSAAKSKPSEIYGLKAGEVSMLQTAIGSNTTTDFDEEIAHQIASKLPLDEDCLTLFLHENPARLLGFGA